MRNPMFKRVGMRNVTPKTVKYPKGFDIHMFQIMEEYELTEDQLKKLGELTATHRSGLAHATVGYNVFYRRRQIEEMLGVKPIGKQD